MGVSAVLTWGMEVEQPLLFDLGELEPANSGQEKDVTSTFQHNLSLPIHRWFRYSAGFSALWVRDLIEKEKKNGRRRVLDPFTGSGTVVVEGENCEVESVGIEPHPLVYRIAQAKLHWRLNANDFYEFARGILENASKLTVDARSYPPLIRKCYPSETLQALDSLRLVWEGNSEGSPRSELAWLLLVSILRECSPVGTAQWQYVLPKKNKAKNLHPYLAFRSKAALFSRDMAWRQKQPTGPPGVVHCEDARTCSSVPDGWADLVITSPPYANNYDYADATRLEMTFMGDVIGWGCLQETVRKHLIRSCTQHVSPLVKKTFDIVSSPILAPIAKELLETCKKLERERDSHGGKKNYHTMIAAYFKDMAEVWMALRRVAAADALVCFVVGDSAPYGVYVPVDRWLGKLAVAAGFKSFTFEKTRDRNVKWKNRKHRVPLHEGRLWVKG
jgi:DNA modification methylase